MANNHTKISAPSVVRKMHIKATRTPPHAHGDGHDAGEKEENLPPCASLAGWRTTRPGRSWGLGSQQSQLEGQFRAGGTLVAHFLKVSEKCSTADFRI